MTRPLLLNQPEHFYAQHLNYIARSSTNYRTSQMGDNERFSSPRNGAAVNSVSLSERRNSGVPRLSTNDRRLQSID